MTLSDYDQFRPPEPPRKRRFGKAQRSRRRTSEGRGDGSVEMLMVPEVEFTSYYGHNVVKPPPWGPEVAAYLFLGGVAGGSGLLALGALLTGRNLLRRNARLGAMAAVAVGGAALVKDLGRPDRFYNMLRTIKLTSPMSIGSWILTAFSVSMSLAVAGELDRLTGERIPLGPVRKAVALIEGPAGFAAAAFAPPLAAYTAVLLSDTANPTWNAAHRDLPFVFVSSASLAAGGLAMITTPVRETRPARALAVMGVVGDVMATKYMESRMDPLTVEPLHHGRPGQLMAWSERLAVAGGVGTLLVGRRRIPAAVCGAALMGASALTRFGVLAAGIASAKDPKYTVEPQKRRLAARRAAGVTEDSITTA
ncbi:NrfD/PsrC family molybdoenzyme membrane anchor subunit [Rudaeicoccus suwonensis]|uniref:Formate-dependent nitrite reductase membrane component NrfD n=1 Tax=Rudaeicoccus suwonensis TaxID=657409 RepID=A0A561E9R1_9MICO|nr:NrfD/PsrC family molybdoenzyme membrane anchor subunit [Rudaeicoccus suwonensis]TWE12327.1 formate-dependent nitrite reductase membrane component NrfD [Rudaeicoccus suwonensis]